MRIYVPATMQMLVDILDHDKVPVDVAYALTPALREWYSEGDDEQLEFAAMSSAARASLRLLAERPESLSRRVVLALDVPEPAARPAPDIDRAAVRLAAAMSFADVVSAHVDDDAAEPDVRAALRALAGAAAGDEDAEFLVDAVEDHQLAWYARQEISVLVAVDF